MRSVSLAFQHANVVSTLRLSVLFSPTCHSIFMKNALSNDDVIFTCARLSAMLDIVGS